MKERKQGTGERAENGRQRKERRAHNQNILLLNSERSEKGKRGQEEYGLEERGERKERIKGEAQAGSLWGDEKEGEEDCGREEQ